MILAAAVGLILTTVDTYIYRFENPRFEVSCIEVRIKSSGEGAVSYLSKGEETVERIVVPQTTLQRLKAIVSEMDFLDNAVEYDVGKHLEHMGVTIIRIESLGRSREVRFHYTSDKAMTRLVELFRSIETQCRRMKELSFARQYAQLDLPRCLKLLENDLRARKIAEPQQLVPLLEEISLDDSIPLIARNAATKLVALIRGN
ncbi:MAG: hypothetical protein RMM17_08335 [Acidobacteriota bacterium]|nr:hypothetical protein [Blastocatellia bacterium]MDW8412674.1 hypothetical protein [Acidobacteriota bacterium]